ncbi:DNA-deoxyinosine glycosylase [Curtanaerobium respiraculi]|uniref:DNA-deoxyinosine glycosylase n=1 Tax=Curtanaerobium respiraculi TaxID=2949669 RepID=UPI0024B37CB2|nr:DNA-deoxyinosine glycosylase [Curtanaerobium respiraculi]
MPDLQFIIHPLDPIFDEHSKVLVLGTMPSPESREAGFYYGHPQNRFWRVMAQLFDEPLARSNDARRSQMLAHGVALWDVLAQCEIIGASDASIRNPKPNDLNPILNAASIRAIFCTGAKSFDLYRQLCESATGRKAIKLPSTSAANAAKRLPDLVAEYRAILPYLA